jgi:hypothetical protein
MDSQQMYIHTSSNSSLYFIFLTRAAPTEEDRSLQNPIFVKKRGEINCSLTLFAESQDLSLSEHTLLGS